MRRVKTKKNFFKQPFFSFLVFISVLLIIILLVISNVRMYERRAEIQYEIDKRENRIAELEERNYKIRGASVTDEEFLIEKIAREQLLLKRPGEEVVFFSFPKEEERIQKEELEVIWWNPLTWVNLMRK